MTKRVNRKPGPKSRTRSSVLNKYGNLGEELSSSWEDDESNGEESYDKNPSASRKQKSNVKEKSHPRNERTFRSPEADTNITDYGLEFTTSRLQNPLPQRCSTFQSSRSSSDVQTSSANAKKTTKVSGGQPQTRQTPKTVTQSKQTASKTTKKTTATDVIESNKAGRRSRKQSNPFQMDIRFWKEVKNLQNRIDNLIPKLPFSRLIRQIMMETSTEVTKITPAALEALQTSTELYMTQRLQDAYMLTLHRGRVTLDVKDMQLINYLKIDCNK